MTDRPTLTMTDEQYAGFRRVQDEHYTRMEMQQRIAQDTAAEMARRLTETAETQAKNSSIIPIQVDSVFMRHAMIELAKAQVLKGDGRLFPEDVGAMAASLLDMVKTMEVRV